MQLLFCSIGLLHSLPAAQSCLPPVMIEATTANLKAGPRTAAPCVDVNSGSA